MMKCTAEPCNGILQYKGGENTEDYGCNNRECWAREVQYRGNVKVRPGWYYLAGYHLPFRWIDTGHRQPNYHYTWYSLVGTPDQDTTLQGIKLVNGVSVQETLHTISYVALPANNDFLEQFHVVRDRIMNEWLSRGQRRIEVSITPSIWYQQTVAEIDQGIFEDLELARRVRTKSLRNKFITVTPEVQRLITSATIDTVDDSAERAAMEACRILKRLLS